MHITLGAALFLLLGIAGCGDEHARIRETSCVFGEEHRLSSTEGPLVHDLALRRTTSRIWALFSDRSGLYASGLEPDGAPLGPPIRLTRACDGGLAAASHEETLWIACGRRGDSARADEGGVQLLSIRERAVRNEGALGALGPRGEGIGLAVSSTGRIAVGWQEGHASVSHTWIRLLTPEVVPERLSDRRFLGSRPSLEWQGDQLAVTWSETWPDARGRPEGRVMLRIGERAARAMAETRIEEVLPTLRPNGPTGLLLTFRDRLQARSRPRVRLSRIESDGTLSRLEDGSAANAAGESIALRCGQDVFVIAPRSRSRTERLIGVRRYRSNLEPHGPELQLYEHGIAYEHADAQCIAGHLVILYASRPTRVHPHGSVRAVSLTCDANE